MTSRKYLRSLGATAAVTLLLSGFVGILFAQADLTRLQVLLICLASALYLWPLLGFMSKLHEVFQNWMAASFKRLAWAASSLLLPYLLYASCFPVDASWGLLRYGILLLVGLLGGFAISRATTGRDWMILLFIICLWLPFETGWFDGIWSVPVGDGLYFMNVLFGVNLVLLIFPAYLSWTPFHLSWQLSRSSIKLVNQVGLLFMAIALPFSFATGFLSLKGNPSFGELPLQLLAGFLFVALPEEILFRGLIQQHLSRMLSRPWYGLVLTALFFGAVHWNNQPIHDGRYVFVASLAGLAYGYVYQRTHSLTAAALLHTLVNGVNELFFVKVL